MKTAPVFEDVLADLYAGALEPAAWERAVSSIMQTVRASAGTLLAFDPSTGHVLRAEDYNVDPVVSRDYSAHWSIHDVRIPHGQRISVWEPMTEETLRIPGWRKCAILNEFLIPCDAPHFMPAWLYKSERRAVTLSLQGTRTRGPFERVDLESFARFAPHVTRALEIRERLAVAELSAGALAQALGRDRVAVLLLDTRGRVLEANSLASACLQSGGSIGRKADGTLAIAGAAGRTLMRLIGSGLPAGVGADGTIIVPREGRLPLSLTVAPVPCPAEPWFGSGARWLVTISDPERRLEVSAFAMAQALGLSTREAEIAALIAAGVPLSEVSRRLQTSLHTVRTQLKSIYRKTGWHTQVELVRNLVLMAIS